MFSQGKKIYFWRWVKSRGKMTFSQIVLELGCLLMGRKENGRPEELVFQVKRSNSKNKKYW